MYVVGALVMLWGFVGIWASAFQCAVPHPYLYTTGKCFQQVAFWDAIGVIDIITDLAIMALPVIVVRNLQLPLKKKINVVFAFSFRVLAIGSTVFRLVELPKSLRRGTDVTLAGWLVTVATSLEVFFSIFATCVPHLRPFMESIQAGYLSGVINEGDTPHSRAYADSYLMNKVGSRTAGGSKMESHIRSQLTSGKRSIDLPKHGQKDLDVVRPSIGQAMSTNDVVTTVRGGNRDDDRHGRQESVGSEGGKSGGSTGSKAMIIKTTKEWSVSYQE